MSGLLIRADLGEKVLRSVGDAPNGIVCIVAPDHVASWAIDAAWQPPNFAALPHGGVITVNIASQTGLGEASTIVATDDLAAALDGPVEAEGLLQLVCASAAITAQRLLPRLEFEPVASYISLAKETRDALARHGWMKRTARG